MDGDLVLFLGEDERYGPVAASALFSQFDAALLPLTSNERWSVTLNTPLSIPWAIDHLVPRIEEALLE